MAEEFELEDMDSTTSGDEDSDGSVETENTETETESEESDETDESEEDESGTDKEESDKTEEDEKEGESKKEAADKTEQLDKAVFSKVKEKYPELFKEFPQLRHAFFREQEFSKVFPTVDDAKEAFEAARNFDVISSDLMDGRVDRILATIGKSDPDAYRSLVGNLLPTLYHLDKDSFLDVTQPVIENALRAAYTEGVSSKNKNLYLAAQYIKQFLFNNAKFEDQAERKADPEKDRLVTERNASVAREQQRYEAEVHQYVDTQMKSMVMDELDPDNSLSEFTRNKIAQEVIDRVNHKLSTDSNHMNLMQSLWAKGARTLNPEYQRRIATAFLTRAKDLVPQIRNAVKAEAMKNSKTTNDKKKAVKPRRIGGGGDSTKMTKGPLDPKKIDYSKTSDADILFDKITFKKT